MKTQFHGTGVALITPMHQDGSLDLKSLTGLVGYVSDFVDYLVVLGTTGEASSLDQDEKNRVVQTVIKANTKGLPIVLGVGGNNTNHVVELLKSQDFTGISALLSVSPYYNRPSQAGLRAHFEQIADASELPIILYNVPSRTAQNMESRLILSLAAHPNIIGIKEASGNMNQCIEIALQKPKDFLLISGDDLLTLPMMALGAVGAISVIAGAFPQVFGRMVNLSAAGEFDQAMQALASWQPLNQLMYQEGNPTGLKYLLSLKKLCRPYLRLPLVLPSRELQNQIENVFLEYKLKF